MEVKSDRMSEFDLGALEFDGRVVRGSSDSEKVCDVRELEGLLIRARSARTRIISICERGSERLIFRIPLIKHSGKGSAKIRL